jgi:asparagine synthase (glutamine-hydrolysing)
MCGIAGILTRPNKQIASIYLKKMTDALAHRGPDAESFWYNKKSNVALGHRRLSIIDLSDNAMQPMHYLSRYTITFNGEIYNYTEIKAYLLTKGYLFTTQSDTEVILAAYDFWKQDCVQQFDGMFSLAIWDEVEQLFFAARDRFGEKPFYYFLDDTHFIFGSEMKALWAVGVAKNIDSKMLFNYITIGNVQNPVNKAQTFFEDIYALPTGHYLTFNTNTFLLQIRKYYTLQKELKTNLSENECIEKFSNLFDTAIKRRLRSDVPIGTSLSGGLDSSSIVEQLSKNNFFPKTFSAVFEGFKNDETNFINTVCDKYNLQNFKVTPTENDVINQFEKLCYHQEEPFQSASIFAQFKVFELAKKNNIKVLIDGQGADETLAGYNRYIHWYLQEVVSRNKISLAFKEKNALRKNNIPFLWNAKNYFSAFLPAQVSIQLERKEYRKTLNNPFINKDFLQQIMGKEWEGIHKPLITKLNDILHYSVTQLGLEELLRYADRNSMANGVETRLPFLYHELVEFIFLLPSNYKIHDGWTKWILRKTMDKRLPDKIVWRKEKVGFEPPQQQWMQNKILQEYMHEAKKKLVHTGILNKSVLEKSITPMSAHESENFDWRYLCASQIV